MRRRHALQAAGGLLAGAVAGCTVPTRGFDTYRYLGDAPFGGPEAGPWRTLGRDSRRTGYAPLGWLPAELSVESFALTGESTAAQPALVDGTTYFRARPFDDEGGWRRIGPAGLRAVGGDIEDWFVAESRRLATPTVAGNALFLTADGVTRAFDRRDARRCWTYREGSGHSTAAPTVVGDTVYVSGRRVFALDAATGAVQWASDDLSGPVRGTAATPDGVFVTAGGVEAATAYRLDPDSGRQQWATPVGSGVPAHPVVGDLVFAAGGDGRLRALDRSDGSVRWSEPLGGTGAAPPALAEGTVYAAAATGNVLIALDALDGTVRWERGFGGEATTGPTVAGDTVYLPTVLVDGGRLYALDTTGAYAGAVALPQRPTSPLVCEDGRGLLAAGSGWAARLWTLQHPER